MDNNKIKNFSVCVNDPIHSRLVKIGEWREYAREGAY